jgi:uroporphyrin-III C-methyltransferase / precorrin-2 dehydrogenase / sirohydrochlorin ferrochelatase
MRPPHSRTSSTTSADREVTRPRKLPNRPRAGANRALRLPLSLSLEGKKVVIIGGGQVAASKVLAVVATGAIVTLVAPRIVATAIRDGMTILRRPFRAADLDGAWFVVAAATPAVNARVARAANRRRIFVNAVDDPSNGSAHFVSTIRRGDLVLTLSTGGTAPAMARLLREAIEVLLPPDLDRWMTMAQTERRRWLRSQIPMARRVPLLAAAICGLYGIGDRLRTR